MEHKMREHTKIGNEKQTHTSTQSYDNDKKI